MEWFLTPQVKNCLFQPYITVRNFLLCHFELRYTSCTLLSTANVVQEYTIPPEEGVTAYKLRKNGGGTLAPVYEIADDAGSTVISKVQEKYLELEVEPKQILDIVRGQLHDVCSAVVAMDEGQGADKGSWIRWCYSVVLEYVPAPVATVTTSALQIPAVGVPTELILCTQLLLSRDSLKRLSKDEFRPWSELSEERINDAHDRGFPHVQPKRAKGKGKNDFGRSCS
ncbi:hypothetical protein Tco_1228471 [Tanacetum coccineum]